MYIVYISLWRHRNKYMYALSHIVTGFKNLSDGEKIQHWTKTHIHKCFKEDMFCLVQLTDKTDKREVISMCQPTYAGDNKKGSD